MHDTGHPEYLTNIEFKKEPPMQPALRPAMRTAFLAAVLFSLFIISANLSAAEPPTQLFAGAEVSSDNSYAYLGHVAPLQESLLGYGFVSKLWLDWSRYRYVKDGQIHDVNAPGAEVALGYRQVGENHWWAGYAGLAYRHSGISPDDATNNLRGSMLRPIFQLEGEQALDQEWRVAAGSSYIVGPEAYWVRGRVLRNAWPGMQIGLEAITQGDPNYYANQFGAVLLGLKAGNTVNVGLKVGKRQVERLERQNYFGIELGVMY